MSVNKKNLYYCKIEHDDETYDRLVAVSDLDEINNILQEWAYDELGEYLTLPGELIEQKLITDLTTLADLDLDEYVYLQSPASVYMDMPRYAGISGTFPTLPTTLAAGYYVCPACSVFIYSLTGQAGVFGEFSVAAGNLVLAEGLNFIGISYASGTPVWYNYSSYSSIDFSTVIPVATVLYFEGVIYNIPFGQNGYGLPEKLLKITGRKKEFTILDAYTLALSGLYVELGQLIVGNGINEITCLAADTETPSNDMYLYYKDSSSIWQKTKITQVNNTQYQTSGSGLGSLTSGEYVINYLFRVVEEDNVLLFNVLSGKYTSLQNAINAGEITDIPDIVKKSAVCVGRVIIAYNASTAEVQKVVKNPFGS